MGCLKIIIDELIAGNPAFENSEPLWLHHFGESLLHPEFHHFIGYASDRKIHTCLSVNPVMLNSKTADRLIHSNLFLLYLSLDGHDEESFHRVRGVRSAYKKSMDRIKMFLEKKVKSTHTCKVVLSTTDFGVNKDSIEKMRRYGESTPGIDSVLLKRFSTWDGNAKDVAMLMSDEQYMLK